ncbi:MAG TPA: CGNR zinc finger domain-containing protein [Solirubrobacteraceae bacterium]|nr:CGNR zinc finger domain-containing protein [Solirubrobacteraceae bacterium]
MSRAALVVALANARADRRPPHAPRASFHDALSDAESASVLLEPFLGRAVEKSELTAVRALQAALVPVLDALVDGAPPPLEALNALAERAPAIHRLELESTGTLRALASPGRPSAAGTLVLEVLQELSELEPRRLRRCERPECRLVFYDATRSSTQRWHADSPCGLRERQRRHRAKRSG